MSPRVMRALAASSAPSPGPAPAPEDAGAGAAIARPHSPITSSRGPASPAADYAATSLSLDAHQPSGAAAAAAAARSLPVRPRTAARAPSAKALPPRATIFFAARPASAAPRRSGDAVAAMIEREWSASDGGAVAAPPPHGDDEEEAGATEEAAPAASGGGTRGFTSEYVTEPAAATRPRTATHRGRVHAGARVFRCVLQCAGWGVGGTTCCPPAVTLLYG